ncbi:MAG TPA: VIT1/CCC1 transporter family protein [Chloroflexota bacterium]|nr:VIT1/CCC1 transporter family protein [Chloroflexota bacterium]
MPQTPHVEQHFTGSERIRDIVIGMADGLTVPFALAAALSGAVATTSLIVTAGLAEIAAGAIAMGLGGYLAGRSDAEHYTTELEREHREVKEVPQREEQEIVDLLAEYGVDANASAPVVAALREDPDAWVRFMIRFELGLEKPDPHRALTSGMTIAAAYIVGGMIPLSPYIVQDDLATALPISVILTLIALAVFGYFKGYFTAASPLRSAAQTLLVGGLAAATAYFVARAIS